MSKSKSKKKFLPHNFLVLLLLNITTFCWVILFRTISEGNVLLKQKGDLKFDKRVMERKKIAVS